MKKTLLAIAVVAAGFSAKAQLFSEDFTAPQAWSVAQGLTDTDTNNWFFATVGSFASQGTMVISESWQDNGTTNGLALTPDNYLFSPVIDLSSVTGTVAVSFKAGSPEASPSTFFAEYLTVYAYDGILGLATATPIHDEALPSGGTMDTYTYDISSLVGSDSLILAFRHHNCTDQNFLMLDDIIVSNGLSINENVIEATVYPNPANDVLNIKVGNEVITAVSIISMDGKEVATSTNGTVNVSDLKAGLYIYQVTTATGKIANGNFAKK